MAVKFELDYSEIEKLEKNIAKIPNLAEEAINQVLHIEGVRIVTENITSLMPVSNVHKNHAKDSKWQAHKTGNLEFTIAANKKHGYLVFPDRGLGSSNPKEQAFMQRGLDAATPIIIDKLHERIDKIIMEVL